MCKAFAIATVVALFAPSVPAFSQAVEIAPGGPDEAPPSQGRSVAQPDDCGKLQQACLDEDGLGLGQGQSNCQHFRDACGSSWIRPR